MLGYVLSVLFLSMVASQSPSQNSVTREIFAEYLSIALTTSKLTQSERYLEEDYVDYIEQFDKLNEYIITDTYELTRRYKQFEESDRYIITLQKTRSDGPFGHTDFSDWSLEEKQSHVQPDIKSPADDVTINCELFDGWTGFSGYGAIDNHDLMRAIQNQGMCGSCWDFAAIAQFELNQRIYSGKNRTRKYSEQFVLDCEELSYGCEGGYVEIANEFLSKTGACFSSDYSEYIEAENDECSDCASPLAVSTGNVCLNGKLSTTEIGQIASAVALSFGMYLDDAFSYLVGTDAYYGGCSGVFTGGHAMTIVGVNGAYNNFTVRNSWGTNWGDAGYFTLGADAWESCEVQSVGFNYWGSIDDTPDIILYQSTQLSNGFFSLDAMNENEMWLAAVVVILAIVLVILAINSVCVSKKYPLFAVSRQDNELTPLNRQRA